MPGVVIQPGSCGTQALGISGDGRVIAGAGCVSSGNTEAFRWTAAGGYQRLGDLGEPLLRSGQEGIFVRREQHAARKRDHHAARLLLDGANRRSKPIEGVLRSLVGVGVINQLVDIHKRLPDNSPPTAAPVRG